MRVSRRSRVQIIDPSALDEVEAAQRGAHVEAMKDRYPPIDDIAEATSWWARFEGSAFDEDDWEPDGPDSADIFDAATKISAGSVRFGRVWPGSVGLVQVGQVNWVSWVGSGRSSRVAAAPPPRWNRILVGPQACACRTRGFLRFRKTTIAGTGLVVPRQAVAHQRFIHVHAIDDDAAEDAVVGSRPSTCTVTAFLNVISDVKRRARCENGCRYSGQSTP